jgi:hypothetical protein
VRPACVREARGARGVGVDGGSQGWSHHARIDGCCPASACGTTAGETACVASAPRRRMHRHPLCRRECRLNFNYPFSTMQNSIFFNSSGPSDQQQRCRSPIPLQLSQKVYGLFLIFLCTNLMPRCRNSRLQ